MCHEAHSRTVYMRRRSLLGREGLAILTLRKLHRQPYFFVAVFCAVTLHLAVLGSCALNLLPSTMLSDRGPGTSRAPIVLLRQGRGGRHAPRATARLVGQPRQALLQKPLRPLVDKAATDPHRGGNGADRMPISEE